MNAIAIGDLYQDVILTGFRELPALGEEAFARGCQRAPGGGAAITAHGLACLGIDSGIAGVVGLADGAALIQQLSSRGVQTDLLSRHAHEPTGLTIAVSTPQDRAFFTYFGANESLADWIAQCLPTLRLVRAVHVAWCPPLDTTILRDLRAAGCFVSLDVGWHPQWLRDPRALRLLRQVDLFFPNEKEAAAITGQAEPHRALAALVEAGVPGIALKCGPVGALLAWQGQIYNQPAPAIEVVDTTGAGDCFDAGFLAAYLHGQDPAACLRQAVLCGTLSIRMPGGIDGFPTLTELAEWDQWSKSA